MRTRGPIAALGSLICLIVSGAVARANREVDLAALATYRAATGPHAWTRLHPKPSALERARRPLSDAGREPHFDAAGIRQRRRGATRTC